MKCILNWRLQIRDCDLNVFYYSPLLVRVQHPKHSCLKLFYYCSALYGIMFGIAVSCIPDTSKEMTEKTGLLTPSRFMVIFVAVVGLSSYAMLIETCGNKEQCNLAHPYVTWIPVSIKINMSF